MWSGAHQHLIEWGSGRTCIELFHGYTYSGHPLAMAAGLATLDVLKDEDVFSNVKKITAA